MTQAETTNLINDLLGVAAVAGGNKDFKTMVYFDIPSSAMFSLFTFLALVFALIIAKKVQ